MFREMDQLLPVLQDLDRWIALNHDLTDMIKALQKCSAKSYSQGPTG